jgi:hypothetical protein
MFRAPVGRQTTRNDLTLLPPRRWRAGDGLDQVVQLLPLGLRVRIRLPPAASLQTFGSRRHRLLIATS